MEANPPIPLRLHQTQRNTNRDYVEAIKRLVEVDNELSITRDFLVRSLRELMQIALGNLQFYKDLQCVVRPDDEFFSLASSELYALLQTMQCQLQRLTSSLIENGAGVESCPNRGTMRWEQTDTNSQQLVYLLNEMLDISRVALGHFALNPEHLNLAHLTQKVLKRLAEESMDTQAQVLFHADEGCTGQWDRRRIEQVIEQLLINAIQRGSQRPIVVRITAAKTHIHLLIQDPNTHISPDELKQLFQRFERTVPAKARGSSELGLFLTKKIIDAHKATIRVESEPNMGTQIFVELPRTSAVSPERF